MGFLRKIGRKIKKGVKKLFSSKIGSFIGSIGLSMMMGPVISKAFNGIKGVFTGATQAGTQAATTAATTGTTAATTGTTAATTGSVNIASNTMTGAMEKLADTSDLFVDFGSKGSVGLKGEATTAALKEKIISTAATGPTVGQQIRQNFVNLGTGVKEFTSDPFGKTKEYLGDSFVPDAVQSIAMSGIKSALTPEYEAPFQSKGVQNVGSDIQSSYMKEVQTQVPNMRATNFNQLNQSLLFGTLSPQYLAQQAQQYS
tara:strand:+ start:2479 stop:3249 length:771 start_codon:yes stop_codon:yes gene_type:complete